MTNRDGIPQLKLSETLFVVPCCKTKTCDVNTSRSDGISVLDSLPTPLANELRYQRTKNASKAQLKESSLLPAYRRYTGNLYKAAGNAFDTLMSAGAEVLIISGGYGIVHAREPIGWYNRKFSSADWPNRLVSKCLAACAHAMNVNNVVGVFSATTGYARVFSGTSWPRKVERAYLASPERRRGAMVKSPRAQGEALAAIARDRHLEANWASCDSLHMEVRNLLAR